jgi:SSS family solute:Na+ symporter
MPVMPAIFFGIMSRKVTLKGAIISVLAGIVIASFFVADQLMGPEAGKRIFPFLHHTLTLNYTYRGMWGTLLITAVLFLVSAFTEKTSVEKLEKTTFNRHIMFEPFQGLTDWRLHLLILSLVTAAIYTWLW